MRKNWWKILSVLLLFYTIIGGFLLPVPKLPFIQESIRNLHFHVPMWFSMTYFFTVSVVYAVRYLRSGSLKDDLLSVSFAKTGIIFSLLGMVTGMEWAYFTWPSDTKDANFLWTGDPKQLCASIAMLIYLAYMVLRGSVQDYDQKAKIAAVYNIFAFAIMVPLIFVIPRMVESLHPGSNGNNPADPKNLDSLMRAVFWPAVLGWILLGHWIGNLTIRYNLIKNKDIIHDKI